MTEVRVAYRHSKFTAAPERLSPAEVWAVAREVRSQLVADRFQRALAIESVVGELFQLEINGIAFEVDWDLDHDVLKPGGKQVLGVTEYDKASPDCVMVSINGPLLRKAETLLRSTIAHELGHVVFDAPGWILIPPDTRVCSGYSRNTRDPGEARANEFMGALLVPMSLLRVDFQRQAKRLRFAPSGRPSVVVAGAPAYDAQHLDGDSVAEAIFALTERYRVSESFLRVRLERYDLLRTSRRLD